MLSFFNLHKNCNTASRNYAEINVIMKMCVLSLASTSKDAGPMVRVYTAMTDTKIACER
jgi:hypothetical protein